MRKKFSDFTNDPKKQTEFAAKITEIYARLNALRHTGYESEISRVYDLLEILDGVVVDFGREAPSSVVVPVRRELVTLLRRELRELSEPRINLNTKEQWLAYLESQMENLEDFGRKIKKAADKIYEREFLSPEEQEELLNARRTALGRILVRLQVRRLFNKFTLLGIAGIIAVLGSPLASAAFDGISGGVGGEGAWLGTVLGVTGATLTGVLAMAAEKGRRRKEKKAKAKERRKKEEKIRKDEKLKKRLEEAEKSERRKMEEFERAIKYGILGMAERKEETKPFADEEEIYPGVVFRDVEREGRVAALQVMGLKSVSAYHAMIETLLLSNDDFVEHTLLAQGRNTQTIDRYRMANRSHVEVEYLNEAQKARVYKVTLYPGGVRRPGRKQRREERIELAIALAQWKKKEEGTVPPFRVRNVFVDAGETNTLEGEYRSLEMAYKLLPRHFPRPYYCSAVNAGEAGEHMVYSMEYLSGYEGAKEGFSAEETAAAEKALLTIPASVAKDEELVEDITEASGDIVGLHVETAVVGEGRQGGDTLKNLAEVTRLARDRGCAMGLPLDELLSALSSETDRHIRQSYIRAYLNLAGLHILALDNPDLFKIHENGEVSIIVDGEDELKAAYINLSEILPEYVLQLTQLSLYNMMREQRVSRVTASHPLEARAKEYIENITEQHAMSVEVDSLPALKDIAEWHRNRMKDAPRLSPDDPKSYPVRLHIRLVTDKIGLLNVDKPALLQALRLDDVLNADDLAIIPEDKAASMSLTEIYSEYLSKHKKEHVAIIGKEIKFRDDEMIIVESPQGVDERICDIVICC